VKVAPSDDIGRQFYAVVGYVMTYDVTTVNPEICSLRHWKTLKLICQCS